MIETYEQRGIEDFEFITKIEAEKIQNEIVEYAPQERYKNQDLGLHPYGSGNFCKLQRISKNYNQPGVYLIKVDKTIKYIGECINLRARFNYGYAHISPRKCFIRGRMTDCRINKKILNDSRNNKNVELWFMRTNEHKQIEKQLIEINPYVKCPIGWNK